MPEIFCLSGPRRALCRNEGTCTLTAANPRQILNAARILSLKVRSSSTKILNSNCKLFIHSAHRKYSDKLFWTSIICTYYINIYLESLRSQDSKYVRKSSRFRIVVPKFEFFEGRFGFLSSQVFQIYFMLVQHILSETFFSMYVHCAQRITY